MNGDLCWVGEQSRRGSVYPGSIASQRPLVNFGPFLGTGIEASDPSASRTTGPRLAQPCGMVIQSVDPPFPDLDVHSSNRPGEAGPAYLMEPFEDVDSCPARGILLAIVLCTPFWIAVYWLLL